MLHADRRKPSAAPARLRADSMRAPGACLDNPKRSHRASSAAAWLHHSAWLYHSACRVVLVASCWPCMVVIKMRTDPRRVPESCAGQGQVAVREREREREPRRRDTVSSPLNEYIPAKDFTLSNVSKAMRLRSQTLLSALCYPGASRAFLASPTPLSSTSRLLLGLPSAPAVPP